MYQRLGKEQPLKRAQEVGDEESSLRKGPMRLVRGRISSLVLILTTTRRATASSLTMFR
jgi:hypothetical protein